MSRPSSTHGIKVLRYLRMKKKFSQSKLGKLSGIPQPVISLYEHGLEIPEGHRQALWAVLKDKSFTPESLDQIWIHMGG